jgi:hypothetical protein
MGLLKSNKAARKNAPKPVIVPKESTNRATLNDLMTQKQETANCPNAPVILQPIVKSMTFSNRPQRYEVSYLN